MIDLNIKLYGQREVPEPVSEETLEKLGFDLDDLRRMYLPDAVPISSVPYGHHVGDQYDF